MNRSHLHALLAVCAVLFAACNSSTTTGDAGDGGGDAGDSGVVDSGQPGNFCKSIGGACTASGGECCSDLSCQNGACEPPAPVCAGYAEPCSASVACCEPAGGAAADLICSPINDAGLSICLAPQGGSACNMDSQCPAPFACVNSACNYVTETAFTCNNKSDPSYHTPCQLGDTCVVTQAELTALESFGSTSDPCNAVGLVCGVASDSAGNEIFICEKPGVEAPYSWSPDGLPFDDTICNPKDASCESYYTGADRAAAVCGPFIIGGGDRCLESCTTGDDCDSVTLDCVKGQCKPNYCYADGMNGSNPTALSNAQKKYGGIAISTNADVLMQPCDTGGDFPTACLPEYDTLTDGTSGLCVRVAGDGGGTWGDPCDPSPDRNNLGGLCQFGYLCALGTCMPWCDLGNVSCPSGTTCQPLPSGPLVSTTVGTSHSIGVCAQICDPYVDDTQNGCQPFSTDAGQPFLGCKFSGNGSDTFPPPGNCAALIDTPIAVGDPCIPGGARARSSGTRSTGSIPAPQEPSACRMQTPA